MSRRQAAHRRKSNNGLSIALITAVVFMITIVVAFKCAELKRTVNEYSAREEQLQAQIDEQMARSEDLEEYEKYTQTKKYIEDVAKEKLGLVYDGEIVFKEDK